QVCHARRGGPRSPARPRRIRTEDTRAGRTGVVRVDSEGIPPRAPRAAHEEQEGVRALEAAAGRLPPHRQALDSHGETGRDSRAPIPAVHQVRGKGPAHTSVHQPAREEMTILALPLAFTLTFSPAPLDTAVFAGGCFWGIEAVFEHTRGVRDVVSGYAGGNDVNPSYEQVSSGGTGH